jgi:hypothetical protein
MRGPKTEEEWAGAIRLVQAQLRIHEMRVEKAFRGAVVETFIDVADIDTARVYAADSSPARTGSGPDCLSQSVYAPPEPASAVTRQHRRVTAFGLPVHTARCSRPE